MCARRRARVVVLGSLFPTKRRRKSRVALYRDHEIEAAGVADYDHVALTTTGEVSWWGLPRYFASHDGRYHAWPEAPAPVQLPGRARAVCAGPYHSCAVVEAGTGHCWGNSGAFNQRLGFEWPKEWWPDERGAISSIPSPPAVVGVAKAVEVACGAYHSCARLESGAVKCWGAPRLLGAVVAEQGWEQYGAHTVEGVADATHIAVGSWHACAALRAGSIVCWGSAHLGVDPSGESVLPVAVGRGE